MTTIQTPSSSDLLREGHYPYPDENVFLVAGMSVKNGAGPDFSVAGMVIASRRADLAIDYFKDVSPDPDAWKSVGCLSLAQVRAAVARIDEMGDRAPTLKEGLLTFGKKQPWAIVCSQGDAAPWVEVVVSASPKTVSAHAEQSGATILGFAPREALVAAIAQMEKTRRGENSKEQYASDIQNGELREHLAEIASRYSAEITESIRQRAARRQGGRHDTSSRRHAAQNAKSRP